MRQVVCMQGELNIGIGFVFDDIAMKIWYVTLKAGIAANSAQSAITSRAEQITHRNPTLQMTQR